MKAPDEWVLRLLSGMPGIDGDGIVASHHRFRRTPMAVVLFLPIRVA
jgi:hypothetical protein